MGQSQILDKPGEQDQAMKGDLNLEKMQDGKIEPKNGRKMMSKDNSERRQVEDESIRSEDMQKKRIDKQKKK